MELIHGECLEELNNIHSKSVDCFICDLPYGSTNCKWDKKIDLDLLWRELKRIAKNDNTPYFFFCDMRLAVEIINSNPKMFRYDIVIHKSNKVGFLLSKKMPMREHELLLVFYKKLPTYNIQENHKKNVIKNKPYTFNSSVYGVGVKPGRYYYDPPLPTSIIKMYNPTNRRFHSTEKSQNVLEWIIKYYTNEGDTILDPTMGSGSTGVACKSLNRSFIGIELDDEYFNVSNDRINNLSTD